MINSSVGRVEDAKKLEDGPIRRKNAELTQSLIEGYAR